MLEGMISNADVLYIWGFRISMILILASSLVLTKDRLEAFRFSLYRLKADSKAPLLVKFLENLSYNPIIKHFIPPEKTNKYKKVDAALFAAGRPLNITPRSFFALKVVIVLAVLLIGLSSFLVGLLPSLIEGLTNLILGQEAISSTVKAAGENLRYEISQISGGMIINETSHNTISKLQVLSSTLVRGAFISLLLYFLPDYLLSYLVSQRKKNFLEELATVQNCLVLMMEAGTTSIYEVLKTLLPIVNYLKPHFTACINEYNINPEEAIDNLARRINTKEFDIIARAMTIMISTENSLSMKVTNSILDHYRKMRLLQIEESIKKKPVYLTLVMLLPLLSFAIIWLTPWIYNFFKVTRLDLLF
ncbi:MAG TPA: hypothetical protein VIK89_02745 [Cytophagaceae bacterium]